MHSFNNKKNVFWFKFHYSFFWWISLTINQHWLPNRRWPTTWTDDDPVKWCIYSSMHLAGIIQCMRPANERQRNTVTLSLLGWAYTQNDSWFSNDLKLTSIWKYIYYLSNVWQVSQGYNYWQITASDSGFVHTYATSNYLKQVTTSLTYMPWVNTLRLKRNLRHFTADIFKCIFLNENIWISLQIALKFVPKVRIDRIFFFFLKNA